MSRPAPLSRLEFLQTGAAALLAGAPAVAAAASAAGRSGIIAAENAREGARDWQLTRVRVDQDGFRSPAVEGYCSRQSVQAGDRIEVMISTNPPRPVRLELFRTGYYGGRGGAQGGGTGSLGDPHPADSGPR